MKIIGERLRHLRETVKLPQSKLAAMLGSTQASINAMKQTAAPRHPKLFYGMLIILMCLWTTSSGVPINHKASYTTITQKLKTIAKKCGNLLKCALTPIPQ